MTLRPQPYCKHFKIVRLTLHYKVACDTQLNP